MHSAVIVGLPKDQACPEVPGGIAQAWISVNQVNIKPLELKLGFDIPSHTVIYVSSKL